MLFFCVSTFFFAGAGGQQGQGDSRGRGTAGPGGQQGQGDSRARGTAGPEGQQGQGDSRAREWDHIIKYAKII